jgi:hypothetical protein
MKEVVVIICQDHIQIDADEWNLVFQREKQGG